MKFFVTGGSRGIGAGIVLQAAAEGHDVAFTYRADEAAAGRIAAQALALAPQCRVTAYRLDVRDSTDVERVGDAVLDDFGTVDVVVPNAGINCNSLVLSMSNEDWHEVLQTNLTGAFYVVRYFLPAMLANSFGRVIFMSSLGAGGVSGQANYAASKAGLLGLSSTLAKEYGRRGITANVLMPGFFDTDMTRESLSSSNRDFWLKYCPQGRVGDVSELAGIVTFLASAKGGFINGQAIPVNGGLDWAP